MKFFKILSAAFMLIAIAGCVCPSRVRSACPEDSPWVRVSVRTAEQKAKGYAGGEMCQMPFSIAICKSDTNHLAIGIDTAGVYVTSNGGQCWQLKRSGIMSAGVRSVAFDPLNAKVIWAAGSQSSSTDKNANFTNPDADGIYKTMDGGEHWKFLRHGGFLRNWSQGEFFAFDEKSFDGTKCSTVYAATHVEGLLKTLDGGFSWTVLGFPGTIINAVVLHPLNSNLLFVAGDSGLYRSDSAGAVFRKIGANLPASTEILGFTVNAKDVNVMYAALGKAGIWRSEDGGLSFHKSMNGIPEWEIADWGRLCSSPVNPSIMYAEPNATGGERMPYWSENGGATWNPVTFRERTFFDPPGALTGHWFLEPIVAHPTEPGTAFQTGACTRKTTDGGRTWKYMSDGISGMRRETRTSIGFKPDDPDTMVFFHTDCGSIITTDGGDTFSYCPPPPQTQLDDIGGLVSMRVGAWDPTPGSGKIIGAVGGWYKQLICISEDDCRTWETMPSTEGFYEFLAFHPQMPEVVYAGRGSDGLRSRTGGKKWDRLRYPIRAMYAGNGDIVFGVKALTENGWEVEVLRSDNQGEKWTALPGKITGGLRDLDVSPVNPDRLYAANGLGVWVFDGEEWSVRGEADGLEKNAFGSYAFARIAVDPTHPRTVYAGQLEGWGGVSRGIFRSTDGGGHWTNISANLGPELSVQAITVSPHDGTVYLATDYGNWKLPPQAIPE